MIQLSRIPKEIKEIIRIAYPDYKGRKVWIGTIEHPPMFLDSYWDEGSRNSYIFLHLRTHEIIKVHSNHPYFEPNQPRKLNKLPEDVLLIERSIFRGVDAGIHIYVNTSNLKKFLTEG